MYVTYREERLVKSLMEAGSGPLKLLEEKSLQKQRSIENILKLILIITKYELIQFSNGS